MFSIDWNKKGVSGPEPQENSEVEDKIPSSNMLHGSLGLTKLNGLSNLKFNWLPVAEDEQVGVASRSKSSSSSDEEIVFRGRATDGSAINIDRVSHAMEMLSVAEKKAEPKGKGRSMDIEGRDLVYVDLSSFLDEESVSTSEDIELRISSELHMSYWEEYKAKCLDPYLDIDLNIGWNRHIYRGLREHFNRIKLSTNNATILSSFAAFSLREQQLVRVHPNLARFFRHVFNATGPVKPPFHTCRSRVFRTPRPQLPPTMIPSKRPSAHIAPDNVLAPTHDMSYTDARTVYLFDCAPATIRNICLWVSDGSRGNSRRKRPRASEDFVSNTRSRWPEKRPCFSLRGRRLNPDMADFKAPGSSNRHHDEMIAWNDQWRKRMRYRAIAASRWTDGTLRQDQMWIAFHWVLDGDINSGLSQQKRAFEE